MALRQKKKFAKKKLSFNEFFDLYSTINSAAEKLGTNVAAAASKSGSITREDFLTIKGRYEGDAPCRERQASAAPFRETQASAMRSVDLLKPPVLVQKAPKSVIF